ncbi:ATP-binding protein [Pseudacidobacterium ailaaui]|uniref:ATP-binding protein n=1 Tax=Pseudacidobacterium ailaaui TaxID=1382359 RepID=UPI00192E3B7E|nr:ATP-binding protein [Pseudacidobacterium ailaaui]
MDDYRAMFRRNLIGQLIEALADTPAVLVNGARQTGKSTLVQSKEVVKDGRHYITFDDPGVLAAARSDPNGFLAGLPLPVTLDEIQHVPELFPVVKAAIDRRRHPGQFLLTGSANVMLLPKISESLAGRMEILTLWPFSQGEMKNHQESFVDSLFSPKPVNWSGKFQKLEGEALLEHLVAGGYPPAVARHSPSRRDAWFHSYIMTMLQRDIRDLANIADSTAIPRLLSVVATRAGSLLNFADLSRTMGLPQTTLKRYFALLEGTFLVQLLRPWTRNLGKRVIQTPKVYLNDSGLLAYSLGATVDRLKAEGPLTGAVLENFVMMELRKQCAWSTARPEMFFWRTTSGAEVDFVLEDRAGKVVGLEVKASATLGSQDARGLRELADTVGKNWLRGVVLYAGREVIPFASNLHGIPMTALWA